MVIMDAENQTTDMPKEIPTGLTRFLIPRIHIFIIPLHTITRIPGTTDMDIRIILHIIVIIEVFTRIVDIMEVITAEHIILLTVVAPTIEVHSQGDSELSPVAPVLHGV